MDRHKIEQGVRLILEGIGEDLQREGLRETPRRVAKMCEEIFAGVGQEPTLEIGFTEPLEEGNLICLKDIYFYSFCEHHLLPFFGKVHLLYIPQGNRVAGFSTLAKIVDHYARRPQIQERLTNQIADAMMKALKPVGVLVMAEATQLCVALRGPQKREMVTVTEATRGEVPIEQARMLLQR